MEVLVNTTTEAQAFQAPEGMYVAAYGSKSGRYRVIIHPIPQRVASKLTVGEWLATVPVVKHMRGAKYWSVKRK